jgi:hypothetical protein
MKPITKKVNKMNESIVKVREQNKKNLITTAKKLIKRVEASGLKHGRIAEAIQASDETFSRFMALKPDYVTKRICTALDAHLKEKGY